MFQKYEKETPRWFSICGKYSLEIYLFHFLFLPQLAKVEMFSILESNSNFTLLILVTIIIAIPVIILSIILSNIIHKSKILDLVFFGNYRRDN